MYLLFLNHWNQLWVIKMYFAFVLHQVWLATPFPPKEIEVKRLKMNWYDFW